MKWVTKARPKIDRVACPWIVKRFVDPQAQLLFVPADAVLTVAEQEGAVPFDVPGVELGHHDDECSLDAFIKKYDLSDPALRRLATIVRGADTVAKDLAPQCAGLAAIAEGFRLLHADDQTLVQEQLPVYDALHAWCRERPVLPTSEPHPSATAVSTAQPPAAVGVWPLTAYFLKLGNIGFGGVALLGFMHRDLVARRRWVTEEVYTLALALADRLDALLDHWMDGVEIIPGDMDSTLLMFFHDQQEEDAVLYRIRP